MQDIGRDDARMQRRAEEGEAGEAQLADDHRLVRKAAADAAIFLWDGGAKQPGRAGLGPHLALIHPLLAPALDMRRELRGHEAARLLFEQRQVLGHPGRRGRLSASMAGLVRLPTYRLAFGGARPAAVDTRPARFGLANAGKSK